MFQTDHPELVAALDGFDPDDEGTRDAAASAAHQYVYYEITRLLNDRAACSSGALPLLESMHPTAIADVCAELGDMLESVTTDQLPGWDAAFPPEAVTRAATTRLLDPDQVPLSETWLNLLQDEGLLGVLGGPEPRIAQPSAEDARVLLALAVIALQALPNPHAGLLQHRTS